MEPKKKCSLKVKQYTIQYYDPKKYLDTGRKHGCSSIHFVKDEITKDGKVDKKKKQKHALEIMREISIYTNSWRHKTRAKTPGSDRKHTKDGRNEILKEIIEEHKLRFIKPPKGKPDEDGDEDEDIKSPKTESEAFETVAETAPAEEIVEEKEEIIPETEPEPDAPAEIDFEIKEGLDIPLEKGTGNSIAIIGSSKSGKTELFRYIYKKYYSGRSWISTLYTLNPQIIKSRKIRKTLIVHRGFGSEEKKVIMAEKRLNDECKLKYKFMNAFDDIIDVSRGKLHEDLILTYRNSKMSTIVMMQYSNKLAKSTRANYNFICLFRFNTDEAIEVAINSFLRTAMIKFLKDHGCKCEKFPMLKLIEVYKKMTENHQFIFYNNFTNEMSIHKLQLKK